MIKQSASRIFHIRDTPKVKHFASKVFKLGVNDLEVPTTPRLDIYLKQARLYQYKFLIFPAGPQILPVPSYDLADILLCFLGIELFNLWIRL